MKNILLVIMVVGIGALSAVCVWQQRQANALRAQLTSAQNQLAEAQAELEALQSAADEIRFAQQKAQVLQDTLRQTAAAASEQSEQVARLEQSLAAAQTNAGPNFSAIFDDPDMREMIREQQKTMMGPILDQQFGALFKQLNLNPEQEAELRRLLEKRLLDQTELGLTALGGDATQQEEAMRKLREQSKEINAAIKELLGDDAYAAFQDYERRSPDRTMIGQFGAQLAGAGTPLEPSLEQQLIDAMYQERSEFQWTTDFSSQEAQTENFRELFSEDRVNTFMREKEAMDQNYLNRVQHLLQPEQYSALEKFLATQRNMQVMGMKMATRMFGNPGQQGQ